MHTSASDRGKHQEQGCESEVWLGRLVAFETLGDLVTNSKSRN